MCSDIDSASLMRSGAESRRRRCPRNPPLRLIPGPAPPPSPSHGNELAALKCEPALPAPLILAHALRPLGSSPRSRAAVTSPSNCACASGTSNEISLSSVAILAKPFANCVPLTNPVSPRYPSSCMTRRGTCGFTWL